MNIQIVLFEGFDLLDVIAPYEVFTAANQYTTEKIDVQFVDVTGKSTVPSGINEYPLTVHQHIDLTKKGIVLIPGSSGSVDENDPDSIPVKLRKAAESELGAYIHAAMNDSEILMTSVCGGSLLMAMTGALEGRNVVTHHMGMGLLPSTGANPINARIVDDGNLITSAGVTSGLDLGIYIVERELGPRIAHEVEQLFQYEKRGTVWKNEGNEPIIPSTKTEEDEDFIEQTHEEGFFEEIEGKWDVKISTPIGKLQVTYELEVVDNQLRGTAIQNGDESNISMLENTSISGNRLKWTQKVTKPVKLQLDFDAVVHDDQLQGKAKAGMIASKLSGVRLSK